MRDITKRAVVPASAFFSGTSVALEGANAKGLTVKIKQAFGLMQKRPKHDSGKDGKATYQTETVKSLIQAIHSTYLNPKWMGNFKFSDSAISASGIAPYLSVNGKLPDNLTTAVEQNLREVLAYAQRLHTAQVQWARRIDAEYAPFFATIKKLTPEVKNKAQQILKSIGSPFDHAGKPPALLGGRSIGPDKQGQPEVSAVSSNQTGGEIPALNEQTVVQTAHALVKALETFQKIVEVEYSKGKTPTSAAGDDLEDKFPDAFSALEDAHAMEYADPFYWYHSDANNDMLFYDMEMYVNDLGKALHTWIDRSFDS